MPVSVLIVDDSPIARKMLIRSLPPDWDMQFTEAGDGMAAMTSIRARKPDLMFLDLTMPEMDGYQVLEQLRKENLDCRVIVVSADIQPRARDRVIASGAMAFIKKPIDTVKLEVVLKEHGILN